MKLPSQIFLGLVNNTHGSKEHLSTSIYRVVFQGAMAMYMSGLRSFLRNLNLLNWLFIPALGILTLAGCGVAVSTGSIPLGLCEIGDEQMVRDVIYFGRNRPSGATVSELEWKQFLDDVVTPRFPAGLTVVSAVGQWKGASGLVEQEQSEIVTILHQGDKTARQKILELTVEYKNRFNQEAVLRERISTCTHF